MVVSVIFIDRIRIVKTKPAWKIDLKITILNKMLAQTLGGLFTCSS